ncbi:MAG: DUF4398 and OmpA-like domain-containing protein [Labilithrix sp.]|nr:DUF4398 and OmpA-like domain-containing protein [Labilithrix sp.]
MKSIKLFVAGAAACALALGCSSKPPRELRDARQAYTEMSQASNAALVQTDVYEAKKALDAAERAYDADGDEPAVRDLAYIAQRKALAARYKGETLEALRAKQLMEADLQQWREQQALAARAQLEATKQQLMQQQIESERRARAQAEAALAKIEGMKSSHDTRGTILTIPGQVLFASGKSELLPTSQGQLMKVAAALKDDPRSIMIAGHSDSKGKDDANMTLSQKRAEAVKAFLTSHGVAPERVQAQGMGATQPVGSNETNEGRANNRRVEVILLESVSGQGGREQPVQQAPGPQPDTETPKP